MGHIVNFFPARPEEYKRKQKRHHAHAVEDEEPPANMLREQTKEHVLISTISGSVTPREDTWLIDSGASKHMTVHRDVLSYISENKFSQKVTLGDDYQYPIKGVGESNYKLNSENAMKMKDVLYVLGLTKKLLSISSLQKNPCELWHRRLAHINEKVLPYICKAVTGLPELKVDHEGVCNGCVQGKNIKNPFPMRDNKAEGVLELIHSNVCGPIPSSSMSGYVYYVSFIDDYSRKTWLYILKSKDEVFSKFN
jgi:hypothetical protein